MAVLEYLFNFLLSTLWIIFKNLLLSRLLIDLIITIQTGVNQIKYIIYIVLIVSIILGLCLAFKEQRKLSRKM